MENFKQFIKTENRKKMIETLKNLLPSNKKSRNLLYFWCFLFLTLLTLYKMLTTVNPKNIKCGTIVNMHLTTDLNKALDDRNSYTISHILKNKIIETVEVSEKDFKIYSNLLKKSNNVEYCYETEADVNMLMVFLLIILVLSIIFTVVFISNYYSCY